MSEEAVKDWIFGRLVDVGMVEAGGDCFFFYKPPGAEAFDQKMPFATLVTRNDYDTVSRLEREGVYRLNIGVRPETYRTMFGPQPSFRTDGVVELECDFAELDRVLPNPVYAAMSWICVLNPSEETLTRLESLLSEAHEVAKQRQGEP